MRSLHVSNKKIKTTIAIVVVMNIILLKCFLWHGKKQTNKQKIKTKTKTKHRGLKIKVKSTESFSM